MTRPRFPPLLRLLFFIGGSVALTILVSLVIGWAMAYSARVTPGMPPPDMNAPGIGLFFTALIYPPLLIWTWFCRHVFDRRNYVSLGLGITRAGRNFLAGGALGMLSMALLFGVLLLCGGARINGFSPEAINRTAPFVAQMLLLYGALYFAVGYFEETIFRGYLLQNFSALLGKSGGIAAQAVLFALIHLMNPVETTPLTRFFRDAEYRAGRLAAGAVLSQKRVAVVSDWFSRRVELFSGLHFFAAGFGRGVVPFARSFADEKTRCSAAARSARKPACCRH